MGNQEIYNCVAPALGGKDGFAIWHLLPLYPTLQNVVELLMDSPEYFQMFWNSIFYTGQFWQGRCFLACRQRGGWRGILSAEEKQFTGCSFS